MIRRLETLIGGAAAAALLLVGSHAFARPVQGQGSGQGDEGPQGPIEILIVQGYVKSIDAEHLTLTAPGAPADLPLRLAPDTRFIQAESDISRSEIHEGQLVRAALVPVGEDFLAVVVELVPAEPGEQAPGEQAPGEQAPAPGGQQTEPAPSGSTL